MEKSLRFFVLTEAENKLIKNMILSTRILKNTDKMFGFLQLVKLAAGAEENYILCCGNIVEFVEKVIHRMCITC